MTGSRSGVSGVLAPILFLAANSLIHRQCAHGRAFPSRLPLRLLRYAANHGHVCAMSRLGCLLFECGVGQAVKRNGLEYIREAAKAGDREAQYALGVAYMHGQMSLKNPETACHWLALAADRGHPTAASELAQCRARMLAEAPAPTAPQTA